MMLTASEQGQVDANFDRQLAPLVIIESGESTEPDATTISPLSKQQAGQVIDTPGAYSGGELSTWRREITAAASRYGDPQVVPVFGASSGGLEAAGIASLAGADLALDPPNAVPGLVWVGEDLARDLGFTRNATQGQILIVDGRRLTVAGVTSAGTRYPALGRAIIVSSEYALTLWGPPEQARFVGHVRRGSAPVASRHLLTALDPTLTAALRDATPPDGRFTRERVGADVQQAGVVLSAIALVFGVISVANVFSSSVVQRTKELGLRSALGWTTTRISRLILTEACILGLYASILGAATGLVAAWLICRRHEWDLILPTTAIWLPPLAGLLAGLVGGAGPAIRAGRISPTEALRN